MFITAVCAIFVIMHLTSLARITYRLFDGWLHTHAQRNLTRLPPLGHIRILGIGLELACNGGSCGGISLKRDKCHLHLKDSLHSPQLQANPIPGI